MCAKNIHEAMAIANHTSYGLTSGLISLDRREHELWTKTIRAGNCYINRSITGAIVDRQPFGGCKGSSFGIGMKVGGPNYLLQLVDKQFYQSSGKSILDPILRNYVRSLTLSNEDLAYVKEGLMSYTYWWNSYFNKQQTIRALIGQNNLLRYTQKSPVFILTHEGDEQKDVALLIGACLIVGCVPSFGNASELVDQITKVQAAHVRALEPPEDHFLEAISPHIACLDISKPSLNGRIELLSWLREVSLSFDYHRYGSL
jgi:RHH-type transcriptional regulator, proline utilization regulon repressor / proline dehydrogenase / delta 1-pyrroline-5-carboxylate dehydrogenase